MEAVTGFRQLLPTCRLLAPDFPRVLRDRSTFLHPPGHPILHPKGLTGHLQLFPQMPLSCVNFVGEGPLPVPQRNYELTGNALVPSAGINGCPSLGRAGMPGGCVRLGLVLTVQQWNEGRADTQTLGSGELCMQQPQPQQPKPQPGLCAGAVGVCSSQQEVRVGEKFRVAVLW